MSQISQESQESLNQSSSLMYPILDDVKDLNDVKENNVIDENDEEDAKNDHNDAYNDAYEDVYNDTKEDVSDDENTGENDEAGETYENDENDENEYDENSHANPFRTVSIFEYKINEYCNSCRVVNMNIEQLSIYNSRIVFICADTNRCIGVTLTSPEHETIIIRNRIMYISSADDIAVLMRIFGFGILPRNGIQVYNNQYAQYAVAAFYMDEQGIDDNIYSNTLIEVKITKITLDECNRGGLILVNECRG